MYYIFDCLKRTIDICYCFECIVFDIWHSHTIYRCNIDTYYVIDHMYAHSNMSMVCSVMISNSVPAKCVFISTWLTVGQAAVSRLCVQLNQTQEFSVFVGCLFTEQKFSYLVCLVASHLCACYALLSGDIVYINTYKYLIYLK